MPQAFDKADSAIESIKDQAKVCDLLESNNAELRVLQEKLQAAFPPFGSARTLFEQAQVLPESALCSLLLAVTLNVLGHV